MTQGVAICVLDYGGKVVYGPFEGPDHALLWLYTVHCKGEMPCEKNIPRNKHEVYSLTVPLTGFEVSFHA